MGISRFLDLLYKTPRDWRVDEAGAISRPGRPWQCPWSEVLGNKFPGEPPKRRDIVNEEMTHAVWNASDNVPGHDPAIRRALLHACGLPASAP